MRILRICSIPYDSHSQGPKLTIFLSPPGNNDVAVTIIRSSWLTKAGAATAAAASGQSVKKFASSFTRGKNGQKK
jgi:hypothetical protein